MTGTTIPVASELEALRAEVERLKGELRIIAGKRNLEADRCDMLIGQVSRLTAERDAAREDAARYQFLRFADLDAMAARYWPGGQVPEGEAFDSAIDAAMNPSTQEPK
jgi:hypothetical protein